MDNFGKTIYRLKVGSHLYGLNRPESDVDFMGVFIPTSSYLLGLKVVDEVDKSTKSSASNERNTADDIDDKSYALPKFLHLAIQNNPNIVEVFFPRPEIIEIIEPEMQELVDNRSKFISQKVFHTFTGYAFSQKKKLTIKSERYGSLVTAIELIEKHYNKDQLQDQKLAIDNSTIEMLNQTLKYYKGGKGNTESFHQGMQISMIYGKLVEERDNYGWRVKTDTFDALGYDVKFGYHLVRILAEAYELIKTGELQFPISLESSQDIIRVRSGVVELPELLEIYNFYDNLCKDAIKNTMLPKNPDFKWIDKWLIKTLKKSILEER